MLCHWPGMYTHGTKQGFEDFQQVVLALDRPFRRPDDLDEAQRDRPLLGGQGADRGDPREDAVTLEAPFACPAFTVRWTTRSSAPPSIRHHGQTVPLKEARARRDLSPGTWLREAEGVTACFDLGKGKTTIHTS